MEQSKLVQNILVRARNEALAMRAQSMQIEHIYLAILKVSTLTSEKIAPTSLERDAIDKEIEELKQIFEREQVNVASAGILLRGWMKTKPFLRKQDAEEEVEAFMARAGQKARDGLKSTDLLRAIFDEPKEFILWANEGKEPDKKDEIIIPLDDDLFDAETAPGELPKEYSKKPETPPAPHADQGRDEMYPIPGANSQSGGGSEKASSDPNGGSSHSNSDAKKRMVLPSFDPNEFSGPALTIHNLGDGDGPVSGIFDIEPKKKPEGGKKPDDPDDQPETQHDEPEPMPEKKKPSSGAGAPSKKDEGIDLGAIMEDLRKRRLSGDTAPEEDDEPVAPAKKDPPKPAAEEAKPKREGVDLGAIMEELRQKRLRGESGEETGEPAKTPEPVKKPEPEAPRPSETPAKKSDDGVDLGAIMQELRERRMRGDQGDGDAAPAQKPVTKPAPKPVTKPQASAGSTAPNPVKPAASTIKTPTSTKTGRQIKTTELLGTTYKGGVFLATLKYLLRICIIFASIIGVFVLLKALVPYPSDREAYLGWYLSAMMIIAVYYLLRVIPGLIERKRPPFAQSLKSLLTVIVIAFLTELFFELVYVSSGWVIAIKIMAGVTFLLVLNFGFGKIRLMPDTDNVVINQKFWFGTMSGSPDKLSNQALMVTCMGPIIVATVFWILNRTLNAVALIYMFIVFWYMLLYITNCQSRWYSEECSKLSQKEKKRKKRADFLFAQVVLLTVPAFLLFLSLLFHWFPVPVWAIIVYSIFGLIYIIGTLASIFQKDSN
jgi:predicted nucleic acid-binding Zn ribbon protein